MPRDAKHLKPHRFTSTNQPPPEKKRGIRIKSLMRKRVEAEIDEMIGACIERIKKYGSATELDKLLDRVMGKVKQENVNTNKNMNMTEEMIKEEMEKLKKLEDLDEQGIFRADSET